ncbi:MAG: carboxypeptidase regulatory-like domain-containing protein [Candidatus Brocadia sp.]|jgi:hypothetical protein
MKNILFSIISFVRLRFTSGSSCRIGILFLFGVVLVIERFAYGSSAQHNENIAGLCPESWLQIPYYNGQMYNNRKQLAIARLCDHTSWDRLYAQNMQSGDDNPPTPAYSLQSTTSAPVVTTGAASNVTYNSATLSGTVNARGLSTTVWFQYRIVNGPSRNTFTTQTVIGTSGTEVSMRIIELLPGTTYYYRLVARNKAGTTYGNEASFTTIDIHAPVTTEITPPRGSISINNGAYCTNSLTVILNLSATDNTGVSGYYLAASASPPSQYTAGWTSITPAINYKEDVTYTLNNGDGWNTIYVWYKDASGNVSDTASASIVVDTTPPTITVTNPTSDLTYTTTSRTISISGNASDDVNEITSVVWSNNRGRIETERKTIGWTIPDIDLAEGDNVITVAATDSAGNTGTTTITITCEEANNIPTVITGHATGIAMDSATLTGVVNAMGLPSEVWFQYGTSSERYTDSSSIHSTENIFDNIPVSNRVSGLQAGTTYYYRLVAQNSDGTTYGDEMTFDTLPPKGRISGNIVHFIKGEPVESARLRLKGTKARKKSFKVTFSHENGFFEFKDLDADAYDISVIKTDFKSTSQTVKLEEGEEKEVRITLRKAEEDKDPSKDVKNNQQTVN